MEKRRKQKLILYQEAHELQEPLLSFSSKHKQNLSQLISEAILVSLRFGEGVNPRKDERECPYICRNTGTNHKCSALTQEEGIHPKYQCVLHVSPTQNNFQKRRKKNQNLHSENSQTGKW